MTTITGYYGGPPGSPQAQPVQFNVDAAGNYTVNGVSLVRGPLGNMQPVLLANDYWPIGCGALGDRGSFAGALPFVCRRDTALVLPWQEALALRWLGVAAYGP